MPNRYREARLYLGYSVREVAGFLRVTQRELEELEGNQAYATREVLTALSRLYMRPPEWLLGAPEPPLEVPRALLDFARSTKPEDRQLSPADMLELARFAQFLQHRMNTRSP